MSLWLTYGPLLRHVWERSEVLLSVAVQWPWVERGTAKDLRTHAKLVEGVRLLVRDVAQRVCVPAARTEVGLARALLLLHELVIALSEVAVKRLLILSWHDVLSWSTDQNLLWHSAVELALVFLQLLGARRSFLALLDRRAEALHLSLVVVDRVHVGLCPTGSYHICRHRLALARQLRLLSFISASVWTWDQLWNALFAVMPSVVVVVADWQTSILLLFEIGLCHEILQNDMVLGQHDAAIFHIDNIREDLSLSIWRWLEIEVIPGFLSRLTIVLTCRSIIDLLWVYLVIARIYFVCHLASFLILYQLS